MTYVPNAGHNLEQKGAADGPGDRTWAVNALAAFARAQVTGKELPKVDWKHDDADGRMRLTVTATNSGSEPCVDELEVWSAGPSPRDIALRTASSTSEGISAVSAAVAASLTSGRTKGT